MYVALLAFGVGLGIFFLARGWGGESRFERNLGAAVLLLTLLFFALLDFWGELWWFEALGYESRFWTVIAAQAGFAAGGALLGAALLFLLTRLPGDRPAPFRSWVDWAGAALGGAFGFTSWEILLRYVYREDAGLVDPILGKDVGFFLFALPFYDRLYSFLLLLALVALAAALAPVLLRERLVREDVSLRILPRVPGRAAPLALAAVAAVLAWGSYLDVYHLLTSTRGAVYGAGWTDVHVRIPALYLTAAATLGIGLAFAFARVRRRVLGRWMFRWPEEAVAVAAAAVLVVALRVLALGVVPLAFQWLYVQPNELSLELPYLRHNIAFTRQAFGLDGIEDQRFPAAGELTAEKIERNRDLLSEIRLWDYRALDAVYAQFQEIRLYYEFHDVDVDRYQLDGAYRGVMVSARELDVENLPERSRTFVNQRFIYTHGFGITLAPVNEFTPSGLPVLAVRDIPPVSTVPGLEVTQPRVYYGELTHSPVYVSTEQPELDYPRGEDNVYVRYPGRGGVRIENLWRKFVYGWKFDGTRFFLSSYPTARSRVLFHREIRDRVRTLAPFLELDQDPYVVLVDGSLYWILDAYTTARSYPYGEPYAATETIEVQQAGRDRIVTRTVEHLDGVSYLRNSVKVVIDALDGTVALYAYDESDPILRVWRNIFPDLFRSREEMPEGLRAHVRYPADYLLVQGLVYAKYHMEDPTVFYNQEDLWVRATEKYYGDLIPVEPYYILWKPPGAEDLEFILMLPFTPRNRQVMIGWIAGMSDPGSYGRLLAYEFPKERHVLGPQQVETKIDQDQYLSERLTLWDQRGSRVIRGNVLVVPIEDTLLYVEPIYLQAEAAAYPELRLVVLMHEDRLTYGETFDQALRILVGEEAAAPPPTAPATAAAPADLIREANEAFERYLRGLGEGRFEEASRALESLQEALRELSGSAPPPPESRP